MKTLANSEIKILIGDKHQFQLTVKILEEEKVECQTYQFFFLILRELFNLFL